VKEIEERWGENAWQTEDDMKDVQYLLSLLKKCHGEKEMLRTDYLNSENERYTESHKRMNREARIKELEDGIEKLLERKYGSIKPKRNLYWMDEELYKLVEKK
jgi:hypothetical protein